MDNVGGTTDGVQATSGSTTGLMLLKKASHLYDIANERIDRVPCSHLLGPQAYIAAHAPNHKDGGLTSAPPPQSSFTASYRDGCHISISGMPSKHDITKASRHGEVCGSPLECQDLVMQAHPVEVPQNTHKTQSHNMPASDEHLV